MPNSTEKKKTKLRITCRKMENWITLTIVLKMTKWFDVQDNGATKQNQSHATKLFTAKYGAVTQHQKSIENDKCWDHFKKIIWLALAAIQRENWIPTRREESNNELSSIQRDLLASSAQKIFTVVDRNQHEMCFCFANDFSLKCNALPKTQKKKTSTRLHKKHQTKCWSNKLKKIQFKGKPLDRTTWTHNIMHLSLRISVLQQSLPHNCKLSKQTTHTHTLHKCNLYFNMEGTLFFA